MFESTGDAVGVAGELHGRSIGKEFTLPADGCFDQVADQRAGKADCHQAEAEGNEGDRPATLVVAAAAATRRSRQSQGVVPDQPDQQDAMDDRDQANVQPHVAVEDVAELMGDHPLQFVAGELLDAAAGHTDHRLVGLVASRESVDAWFMVHHVNPRDGQARGNRHLFDDVEHLSLQWISSIFRQWAAAEHQGHRLAPARQLGGLVEAASSDHSTDRQRHTCQNIGPPEGRRAKLRDHLALFGQLFDPPEEDGHHQGIGTGDKPDQRKQEQADQPAGVASGTILMLKKIHAASGSPRQRGHLPFRPACRALERHLRCDLDRLTVFELQQ